MSVKATFFRKKVVCCKKANEKAAASFVAVAGVFIACSKTESNGSALLEGSWRMISVRENGSAASVSNPGNMGDVIVTFAAGKLSAKTPSNDIWPSNYTAGPGSKLSVPAIGGTKVGENAWGLLFYENIGFIERFS